MGGVIGLAICSNVFNSRLKRGLVGILSQQQIDSLDRDTSVLATLTPGVRDEALAVFSEQYNYLNWILIAFAAAQLLTAGMVWNKRWSKLG